jgi:hypothetical protein
MVIIKYEKYVFCEDQKLTRKTLIPEWIRRSEPDHAEQFADWFSSGSGCPPERDQNQFCSPLCGEPWRPTSI